MEQSQALTPHQMETHVSAIEKINQGVLDATALLGNINPLISLGAGLVQTMIADFMARGIDPGPFADRLAACKQLSADILSADAAYRVRHPDSTT